MIVMLGLFLSVSGAQAATDAEVAGTTPDSYFYFMDKFGEWLDLKLTFNAVKKAEKKLEYASERMAEMKTLKDEGKLEKKSAEKIKTDYEELATEVSDDIDSLKSEGKDVAELIKKMEELSSEHTAKLEEVLDKVPEEAREAIEHALEVSKRGHERAIEALSKELEEGNIEEDELDEDVKMDLKDSKEKRPGVKVEKLDIDDDTRELNGMFDELNRDSSDSIEKELNSL